MSCLGDELEPLVPEVIVVTEEHAGGKSAEWSAGVHPADRGRGIHAGIDTVLEKKGSGMYLLIGRWLGRICKKKTQLPPPKKKHGFFEQTTGMIQVSNIYEFILRRRSGLLLLINRLYTANGLMT